MYFLQKLQQAAFNFQNRLHQRLSLALFQPHLSVSGGALGIPLQDSLLQDALWFAVPKQKISRHKKRLKTTVQKRIPLRKDIVADPRTGEITRKHRLPFNWKDYVVEA